MEAIIKNIVGDMIANMENECVKVCQSYGFDVDKERLTQALTDARKFYDEGYRDGKAAAMAKIVRCKDGAWCRKPFPEHFPHKLECMRFDMEVAADEFCSRSERRADE